SAARLSKTFMTETCWARTYLASRKYTLINSRPSDGRKTIGAGAASAGIVSACRDHAPGLGVRAIVLPPTSTPIPTVAFAGTFQSNSNSPGPNLAAVAIGVVPAHFNTPPPAFHAP